MRTHFPPDTRVRREPNARLFIPEGTNDSHRQPKRTKSARFGCRLPKKTTTLFKGQAAKPACLRVMTLNDSANLVVGAHALKPHAEIARVGMQFEAVPAFVN